jgi:hypothetical protein
VGNGIGTSRDGGGGGVEASGTAEDIGFGEVAAVELGDATGEAGVAAGLGGTAAEGGVAVGGGVTAGLGGAATGLGGATTGLGGVAVEEIGELVAAGDGRVG